MKEEEKIKQGENRKLKNAVKEIQIPYLTSLNDCQEEARKNGYTDEFSVRPEGLYSSETQQYYQPEEVRIENFYRFEGVSDPDDNSILYIIEIYNGPKGVLVDGYFIYSDTEVSEFIKRVEEISKKV